MPYTNEQRTKLLLLGLIHCPEDLKDVPESIRLNIEAIKKTITDTPVVLPDIVNAATSVSVKIEAKSAADKITAELNK